MSIQPATPSSSPDRSDQPSIRLHIERLVLEGLPVSHHQGAFVQAAIETELTRLLGEGNLSALSGGAVPHLPVASIQLAHDNKPSSMGRQIAQALYGGLASAPALPRETRLPGGAPE
jgi:hypothetical protein